MQRYAKTIQTSLFLLMLGTCGFQVARSATADPVTVPVAKDKDKSTREAVSRVGGVDTKAPLAAGPNLIGGNGIVEPAGRETKVAAQVTAVVSRVLVEEGAMVKDGDVLVQLASASENAAVAVANADVAAEKANLARVSNGLRVEDLDALAADADAAKARSALSAGNMLRAEELFKSGAVTAEELDRARRQAQADAATWKALDARFRSAQRGARPEEVEASAARVAAAQARLAQAKANLERLTVRAPEDGEILQVKFRQGELYSFQGGVEPLVVMGDTRHLRVRMDVDERDIARVTKGAAAYVLADAFGSRQFHGRVLEVGRRFGRKNVRTDDPVERNDTKILEVVIGLDDSAVLIPGQRVTSFIVPPTAVALPEG